MYYLYLFACWFTHPWRWFMHLFIPGYRHEYFAIRLLFPNSWKCYFVTLQAQILSGNFESSLFLEDNNAFAMGRSDYSKYQSSTNRERAKYWSVYQSIYDYYDYIKRHPIVEKAINDIPESPFKADGPDATLYRDYAAAKFQSLGYFSAPLSDYSDAMEVFSHSYANRLWLFILNWLLSCLPAFVLLVSPVKGKGSKGKRY